MTTTELLKITENILNFTQYELLNKELKKDEKEYIAKMFTKFFTN